MPCGLNQLDQQLGDLRQQPIGPLRQRLHDEVVAVTIDDERRHQVAFAMHQPIRGGVDVEPLAKRDGLLEPRAPERRSTGTSCCVRIRSVICDRSL